MTSPPRAAITALRAWSRRRHAHDALPLRVARRRIYILPTGRGIAFAAVVAAMTIAGLNYANNLAIAFAFVLAASGIVAMHHCHRNLLGLRIDGPQEFDAFAGEPAELAWRFENDTPLHRFAIELRCAEHVAYIGLPAFASRQLALRAGPFARGLVRIDHLVLRSEHPFGWFRAWTYVEAPLTVHVAPAPQGARTLPADDRTATSEESILAEARGDEEFAGLRPYVPGIALKHMAWKTLARGAQPAARRYTGAGGAPLWLDWSSLAGLDSEGRLGQLCLWALDCDHAGRRYGLRLPSAEIEPDCGPAHRRRVLRALAAERIETA